MMNVCKPLRQRAACLVKAADSDEGYALIPEGTWTAGHCLEYARALKRLYSNGRFYGIRNSWYGIEHILIRVGLTDCYLDGHGAHTAAEVLRYWQTQENVSQPVQIVPMTKWDLMEASDAHDIPNDRRVSGGLFRLFKSRCR